MGVEIGDKEQKSPVWYLGLSPPVSGAVVSVPTTGGGLRVSGCGPPGVGRSGNGPS